MKDNKINAAIISVGLVLLGYGLCADNFAALLLSTSSFLVATLIKYEYGRSIGVAATATLLSVTAAELVAPWFGPAERPTARFDRNSDYGKKGYLRPTDVGRLPSRGVHSSRKLSPEGAEIYNIKYSIGDDGFRITSPQTHSTFRINFFGCSFTIGEGLNDNETLPHFVNARLPGASVKNFGFHGWGAHNALAILESHRDTRGTINFFLTSPWHVPRSACKPSWTQGSPRFELAPNGRVELAGRCREKNLLSLMERGLKYSKLYKMWRDSRENKQDDSDFKLYFAIVRQIGEVSRSRHQKFIVGFIKARDDAFGGSGYSNESFRQKLEEAADEVIDLTLADKIEQLDKKFRIHELDGHPTAAANDKRAGILAKVFKQYFADMRSSVEQ
jgi:hypothetical protein